MALIVHLNSATSTVIAVLAADTAVIIPLAVAAPPRPAAAAHG
jgi:hypothetical protein